MSALDIASRCIQMGWAPIPLPLRTKKPLIENWPNLRITADDVSRYFNGNPLNVGVILGPLSGGLSDVDLDCPEAVRLAPLLLPRTRAVFGRRSKRGSHWLYQTDLADTADKAVLRFADPTSNEMLVELRIGGKAGAQTVFPGSVHESGELIEWEPGGDGLPDNVDGTSLKFRVAAVAIGSLLVRHWPGEGSRHEFGLILGGFLARAGWTADDASSFVEAVATVAADPEAKDRAKAARSAAEAHHTGGKAYGLKTLRDTVGVPVANQIADWLGYRETDKAEPSPDAAEDTSGSWTDPDMSIMDDRRGTLPEFPVDTMPALADWLTRSAEGAGATPAHVAVPLLSIASSLIGTARRVRASRSWSEPMTLWSSVLGYSGTSKTPSLNVTTRVLSYIERERRSLIADMRRQHEARVETAKAANKKWKAEVQDAVDAGRRAPDMPPEAVDPGPFVEPRLFVSDSTVERLAVLLQGRPRGLSLVGDELAGLFMNMGRYSSGSDREFWLTAWNGGSFVVERQGRAPVVLDHLLVGITGGLQPNKLVKCFEGDQDGMYARLLIGWPEEPGYQPLSDDADELEPEFLSAMFRLVNLPAEDEDGNFVPKAIKLSPEAVREFEQFRQFLHVHKNGYEGREREWMAKGPGQVLRLAGTLAYLDWAMRGSEEPDEIEPEFLASAVRLWREYFLPHSRAALRLIGLSDRHVDARKVMRWIKAQNKREVSVKDIRRDALAHRLDANQTNALIGTLVEAGWLQEITVAHSGPGRPARRRSVNPQLFQ